MPKLSAGILLYRVRNNNVEVFLVHPGGPFWAKKDVGSWSLPKGEYADGEAPLAAAKREFAEEVGREVPVGEVSELGEVKYSNKILSVWAVKGDMEAKEVHSNTFTMEWPPRSGKTQEFLEVDRAAWCDIPTARMKLVKGQVPLVDMLLAQLGFEPPVTPEQSQLALL